MARERERVVQGATQGDVLVLRDLTKVGWGAPTVGLGGPHCWAGGLPLAYPPFSWTSILPGVPWAEDTSC